MILGRRPSTLSENVDYNLSFDAEDNVNDHYANLTKRFLYLSRKLNHFWNRCQNELVTGFREAHTLKDRGTPQITAGDLVVTYEDKVKGGLWKVGIVDELIAGTYGHVRGAKVRKPGKGKPEILNRPIQNLFSLESTGTRCEGSSIREIPSR